MPYVVLTILLVRGLMLEGAMDGITFYLTVDWNKLLDTRVWIDAAIQIFYSVGAGFGVHLAYASYNKFHNNCYRDCLVTSAVNSFTSLFSGFVIFTYLGYMAKSQNKSIEDVADQGPGLVFEVYPQAVATLPGSQFWSVIFFFMLIMLGMDSAMGGLECVITGLMDEYKEFFRKRGISREMFTGFVVVCSYIVAIMCVTPVSADVSLTLSQPTAAGGHLHIQPAGELRGRPVPADHRLLRGHRRVLGVRPQELLRRRLLHAGPQARPLLEDLLEVRQSQLPGFHHHSDHDGRVLVRD